MRAIDIKEGDPHMIARELVTGEQLTFKAFELAEVVRELDSIQTEKKEAYEAWNEQIKALKKRMFQLAHEVKPE